MVQKTELSRALDLIGRKPISHSPSFMIAGSGERGFGSADIDFLASHARTINREEILVYTGSDDHIARSFYTSLDFKVVGHAHECAPGNTMISFQDDNS